MLTKVLLAVALAIGVSACGTSGTQSSRSTDAALGPLTMRLPDGTTMQVQFSSASEYLGYGERNLSATPIYYYIKTLSSNPVPSAGDVTVADYGPCCPPGSTLPDATPINVWTSISGDVSVTGDGNGGTSGRMDNVVLIDQHSAKLTLNGTWKFSGSGPP